MWNMIFGKTFEVKDVSVRTADQKDSSVEQSMLLTEDLGLDIEFNSIEKRDEFISDLTSKLEGSPIKVVTQSQNRAAALLDVVNDQAETQEGRLATAMQFLKETYGFDAQNILLNKAEKWRTAEAHRNVMDELMLNTKGYTPGKDTDLSKETDASSPSTSSQSERQGCRIC
jgi:hypothetical protein